MKRGFTLIELIVVIAILAIIAAVAVPTAFSSIENARVVACKADETSILSAWRLERAQMALDGVDLTSTNKETHLDNALKNCNVTQSGMEITGLCPSGGTYELTVYDNGTLEIVCNLHDSNEAQQRIKSINEWIAGYQSTQPTALTDTVVMIKKYQHDFDNYSNTPLSSKELEQIFGDAYSRVNPSTEFYLRPMPVYINGKWQNVQYVSSRKIDGETPQVNQAFGSYALIVDGKTYIHYSSGGTPSEQYRLSNNGLLADVGKTNSYTNIQDFINHITTDNNFVLSS